MRDGSLEPGGIPQWRIPTSEDATERFSWGGLGIATNLWLPRLPSGSGRPDLHVVWRLGKRPALPVATERLSVRGKDGEAAFTVAGDDRVKVFDIERVAAYVIKSKPRVIEIFPAAPEDPMEVERFLVNTALPTFAGIVEGLVCLHASAVALNGKATVFAGPSRVGKSTSAWRLLNEGWRLIGDDAVVLREDSGTWMVPPGSRGIRLDALKRGGVWRSGPKVETIVPAAEGPSRLGSIVLLRPDRPGLRQDVYVALLRIQNAWAWGGPETRKQVADTTLRALQAIKVRVDDSRRG